MIIITVAALSLALSTAFMLPSAAGNIFLAKKATTKLILDNPPDQVNIGETVTFTGRLVKQPGYSPVAAAAINIFEKGLGGQNQILATGSTDSNGYFRISWAAFQNKDGFSGADIDNLADVYAYFQGNTENDSALSLQFRIKATNNSSIEITSAKPFYYVSSTAVITISIRDSIANLIDPDDLYVFFDGMPVKVKRIETGVYRFEQAFLTQGDHKTSADARFDGDKASAGLASSAVSISAESEIHVVRRPTVLTASIGNIVSSDGTYPVFFFGDKIQLKAELLDVATGTYITDGPIGANSITTTIVRPDNSVEELILTASGNSLISEYQILDTDPTGVWTFQIMFQGNDQLQPSTIAGQTTKFVVNDYRTNIAVTPEAMANVTIIDVVNHPDSSAIIYELALDIGSSSVGDTSEGLVSFRVPENWTAVFDSSTATIYLHTIDKPIGAGKSMQFQLQTDSLITSFSWIAKDDQGNIIATGSWIFS